jgi:hypothetical protein
VPRYGFVGVGELTAAIVTGRPRRRRPAGGPPVATRPGRELAGRFPNVRVCGSNQHLTDLRNDGVPDVVRRALDRVLDRSEG